MGKAIILAGVLLVGIGVLIQFKIPIPLIGRLPGDIYIKGEHYQIYLPIASSLLLSALLSLLVYLFSKS